MAETCKQLGEIVLKLLCHLRENRDTVSLVNEGKEKLEEVASLADTINESLLGEKAENLADMLESEMIAMDKAIEEAANRIQVKISKLLKIGICFTLFFFLGYVNKLKSGRFGYQIRSQRKNFRYLHDTDASYQVIGTKVEVFASGNCRPRASKY